MFIIDTIIPIINPTIQIVESLDISLLVVYPYNASPQNKNAVTKIAVYDKNRTMIYFGEKTSSFKSSTEIWNTFSNAKYYQDIIITPENNVMCIMPEKEVSLETQQEN